MYKLTKMLILLSFIVVDERVWSKNPEIIEGAMIYQFTRYITWPVGNLKDKTSFDVGIISDDSLSKVLKENLKTRTIHNLPVKFTSPEHILKSQVIVVGRSANHSSATLKKELEKCVCIIIGYHGEDYEHITFKTIDQKLRFEINLQLVKKSGFYISSRLLHLALKVKGQY